MKKNVGIISALSLLTLISTANIATAGDYEELEKKVKVSSLELGWTEVTFDKPVKSIVGITGGWSVAKTQFSKTGPEGHAGSSSQWLYDNAWGCILDKRYPFGALLMSINDLPVMNVTGPLEFQEPVNKVKFSINDGQNSFCSGDNAGNMYIKFEYVAIPE